MSEQVKPKAKKLQKTVRVYVEAEAPNYVTRWIKDEAAQIKALERWAKEFMEFVRDHRSRDLDGLFVVAEKADVCSLCDDRWETMEECGVTVCAACGEEVEAK